MKWQCLWISATLALIIACAHQAKQLVVEQKMYKVPPISVTTYKVPPYEFMDSDNDGVAEYKDKCPNTPKGINVDADGCCLPQDAKKAEAARWQDWIFQDIRFGKNRSRPGVKYYPMLDEISSELKTRPELEIEIEGHSDNTGSYAYNMQLSQRRANSVKAYLLEKGIDEYRITCIAYGPDRPIASNSTADGRAANRRVKARPIE